MIKSLMALIGTSCMSRLTCNSLHSSSSPSPRWQDEGEDHLGPWALDHPSRATKSCLTFPGLPWQCCGASPAQLPFPTPGKTEPLKSISPGRMTTVRTEDVVSDRRVPREGSVSSSRQAWPMQGTAPGLTSCSDHSWTGQMWPEWW